MLSVYIDGVPVQIQRGSVSISACIEERSTASFVVVDETAIASYVRGQPVEVYDSVPDLIFAGFIDTPGKSRIAPNYGLLHDIKCIDNHYLADKRLVIKAYTTPGQTLFDIVTDIFTDYLAAEGIIVGAIQTGPVIESAIFNYVKVSEAFDSLQELSGFIWFIDELKRLFFIDRSTYSAPWNLDGIVHRPSKGSTHLSLGNPLYRNSQYVRGGTGLTGLVTEHFTGDGIIKSFALGYKVALEPTITLTPGGVQGVGIKGIEIGEDFYWSKGEATIAADVAPGIGVDVEVQYYGMYPLIALVRDNVAIVDRQVIEGGGTGLVEDMVTEMQHESSDAITESAKAKIAQYCQEAEKFVYQTTESGLMPGQLQEITFPAFGFTAYQMLIEAVEITAIGEDIRYNVSCITGPIMGSWTRFFASLLTRQDKTIQIGDSLLLVLLQHIETLALAEATDFHSDAFPPDVSRWIALPPAQGAGHHIRHEALVLAEVPAMVSHDTGHYHWDDADAFWDFATWG